MRRTIEWVLAAVLATSVAFGVAPVAAMANETDIDVVEDVGIIVTDDVAFVDEEDIPEESMAMEDEAIAVDENVTDAAMVETQGYGNDTKGEAEAISVNKTVSNSMLNNSEEDWYRFTLPEAGYVYLTWSNDYAESGSWWAGLFGVDTDQITGWRFYARAEKGRTSDKVRLPAGTYYLKVDTDGKYGSNYTPAQYSFKVNAPRSSIAKVKVSKIKDQAYTTKAIKPKPTVKLGGVKLVRGTDYTLSYRSNTAVGTATVIIKGKGAFKGTVTKTFNIVKGSIAQATFSKVKKQRYRGAAIKPKVTVKAAGSGVVLTKDISYTVEYRKNTDPGKATIIIRGKGNFTGTKKLRFKIVKGSIAKAKVGAVSDRAYTGKAIKPKVTVKSEKSGVVLKKGVDYTLSYRDNRERGTATIVIEGKGKYQGVKEVTFDIV